MSSRSRRLVRLATRNKDEDCHHHASQKTSTAGQRPPIDLDENQRDTEHHQASDLDESQECIAEDMKQIISNIFITDSDEEQSAIILPLSTLRAKQVSETSSESESLFAGDDFSDNDPTYHPVEEQNSPNSCCSSIDDDLITLQDLLGVKVNRNIPSIISPQPGISDSEHSIDGVLVTSHDLSGSKDYESVPALIPSPKSFTSRQYEQLMPSITSSPQPGTSREYEQLPPVSNSPQPGTSRQYEEEKNNNNDTDTASEIATLILSDMLDLVWDQVKTTSRWRSINPAGWKKNIAKKRRAEGLSYITNDQIRPPKIPKTVDCSKCLFKCTNVFSEQDRDKICRMYWNLDYSGKKNFLLTRVTVHPLKRVVVERKRPARQYTTKCYFDLESDKRQVCQKFFCSTLSISPSVINDAIKHRDELGFYAGKDGRGHETPPNKTSPEKVQEVVDHISSFPQMEGHYVRNKSKRKYLEATLSINKMYDLYLKQYEKDDPVSEITYRRIFSTQFNLSFFVPKKDQCQVCNKYTLAKEDEKAKLEASYIAHIERKVACEAENQKHKLKAAADSSFISVSFDLQAILQIPCSKVGLLYYVRKLTVYNLTIYESALPNNAFCFNWSEIHGKKGSAEIGSILYHYLSNCISTDVTSVSLFSDTCGGQNRNQNVAAVLLWAVNKIDHLQVIEQNFLESGHSYMEADSMHSSIENAKRNKDIFSMTDWANIFKSARSKGVYRANNKKVKKDPYHVKEFKYHEFFDLKQLAEDSLKNKTKDCNGNQVLWLKIKKMKYVKGDPKIYFNYDVSEVYLNFDTSIALKSRKTVTPQSGSRYSTRKGKKRDQSNPNSVEPPPTPEYALPCLQLRQLYDKPLAISAAKKKDLIGLCDKGVIPEEYHGWFRSLNCDANIVDRVPDVAACESSSEEDD